MKKLLVLVEPRFHAEQYADISISKEKDFLVLKREGGPSSEEYEDVLMVDLNNPSKAATELKHYMQLNDFELSGIIPASESVRSFANNLGRNVFENYNSFYKNSTTRNSYVIYRRPNLKNLT